MLLHYLAEQTWKYLHIVDACFFVGPRAIGNGKYYHAVLLPQQMQPAIEYTKDDNLFCSKKVHQQDTT